MEKEQQKPEDRMFNPIVFYPSRRPSPHHLVYNCLLANWYIEFHEVIKLNIILLYYI